MHEIQKDLQPNLVITDSVLQSVLIKRVNSKENGELIIQDLQCTCVTFAKFQLTRRNFAIAIDMKSFGELLNELKLSKNRPKKFKLGVCSLM